MLSTVYALILSGLEPNIYSEELKSEAIEVSPIKYAFTACSAIIEQDENGDDVVVGMRCYTLPSSTYTGGGGGGSDPSSGDGDPSEPPFDYEDPPEDLDCRAEQFVEEERDGAARTVALGIAAHDDSYDVEYGARIYQTYSGEVNPGPTYTDGSTTAVTVPYDAGYGDFQVAHVHNHPYRRFAIPSDIDLAIFTAQANIGQINPHNYSIYIALITDEGRFVLAEYNLIDLMIYNQDTGQYDPIQVDSLPESALRDMMDRGINDANGICEE